MMEPPLARSAATASLAAPALLQIPSAPTIASQEWVLRALAIGVGVLAVGMMIFAVVVVLLRIKHGRTARRWARREEQWEPILLTVLAGDRTNEDLWQLVGDREHRDFIEYLVRFERRLKGKEREQLTALAAPYLEVFESDVSHRRVDRRAQAIQTLGDLGYDRYQDQVIAALDDPAPLVRMIAARALTRPEHPEHIDLVLDRLRLFSTWSPNFLAAMLAEAGRPAAEALRNALGTATRPAPVRAVVATALAYLGDLGAADVAAHVLRTGADSHDLLASSLRLLAKVGRPEHVEVVRSHAGSAHFAVRAATMSALGALGDARDIPALRTGYDDASPWVAIHAARALVDIGNVDSLEEIVAERHTRASLAIQVLSELKED